LAQILGTIFRSCQTWLIIGIMQINGQ